MIVFKYGKKRPQGATRAAPKNATTNGNNSTPQSSLLNWLLVGFGVSVGAVIASGLFMWQPWQPVQTKKEEATASSSVSNTANPSTADKTGDPKFDFYDLLPNQEVTTTQAPPTETITPTTPTKVYTPKAETKTDKPKDKNIDQDKEAEKAKKAKEKAKAKAEAEKQQTLAKQKAEAEKVKKILENEKAKDTVRYTLQAGSFKNKADADRRRATAALSGLPVKVQKVTVKEGEEWYRVVVGPFTGKENTKEARQTLQSEGIDSLMVKHDKK